MLTRRQLLVRGGGVTVALACFGTLPGGAAAEPGALSAAHADAYAALLDLVDAQPAYDLSDRLQRAGRFAEIYSERGDAFRRDADALLDDFAAGRTRSGALDLAALPYRDDLDDTTILFTLP
jgi:hypothetical protein